MAQSPPASTEAQQFAAAVECMYSPTTAPATRTQADQFLQAFQRSPQAWAVADAFLGSDAPAAAADPSSPGVAAAGQRLIFAALTLQRKITSDFAQLPAASHDSLRTTILRHIQGFNTTVAARLASNPSALPSGTDFTALRTLCVAYASLLVRLRAPPRQAIEQLCAVLVPPQGSIALLEILAALPEEVNGARKGASSASSSPTDTDAVYEMLRGMDAVAGQVLSLLLGVLQAGMQTGTAAVFDRVFRAFGSWVNNSDIPGSVVAACPLLQHCFEAVVKYPQLFDAGTSAIQDIVDRYRNPSNPKHAPVTQILIPAILSLGPLFEASAARGEAGEDACLALSRLVADAGYEYVYFMCVDPEERRRAMAAAAGSASAAGAIFTSPASLPGSAEEHAQRAAFLRLVNRCLAHPSDAVSGATFRFWIMLERLWNSMDRTPTDGKGGPSWREVLRAQIAPALQEVAPVMLRRLRFPPKEDWDDLPADKQDDFRHQYRYDCQDVLLFVSDVVGYKSVLTTLATALRAELQAWVAKCGGVPPTGQSTEGWEGVEAALYAIRSIARFVPNSEAEILPGVFQLLPQLPFHPELRATAHRILGRYSSWLRNHPDAVPGVLDFMLTGSLYPSAQALAAAQAAAAAAGAPASAPALAPTLASPPVETAAKALKDIATVCMPTSLARILDMPKRVNFTSLQADVFYDAGCAYARTVACCMRDTDANIMAVLGPILQRLHLFATSPEAALRASAADGLLVSCLTSADGTIKSQNRSRLGVDEATGTKAWGAAQAQGGSLLPQVSAFPPDKAVLACVATLLTKLCTFLQNCKPDPTTLMELAGVAMPATGDAPQAWASYRSREQELMGAADAALARGMWALQQAAFPVLEALWRTYGARDTGVLKSIADVWDSGLHSCRGLFGPLVPRVIALVGERLSSASPDPEVIRPLAYIVEMADQLNADTAAIAGAVGGVATVVLTRVASAMSSAAAGADPAASAASASGKALESAIANNAIFLRGLFHLLRNTLSRMPMAVTTAAAWAPGLLQLIANGLPVADRDTAFYMLGFVGQLPVHVTRETAKGTPQFAAANSALGTLLGPVLPQLTKVRRGGGRGKGAVFA
jgi:hypothetical protein